MSKYIFRPNDMLYKHMTIEHVYDGEYYSVKPLTFTWAIVDILLDEQIYHYPYDRYKLEEVD